jgi:hypothetical protein
MRRRLVLAGMLIFAACGAFAADGWSRYQNARYGYAIDIPPGFSPISEADNSDGGTSRGTPGRATLSVWGANLLVESFKSDVNGRIESAKQDGWELSLKKVGAKSATWSGTKDDRILYAHAKPGCDGQASYFQIEYDADAKDALDGPIGRMVKTFKPRGECL